MFGNLDFENTDIIWAYFLKFQVIEKLKIDESPILHFLPFFPVGNHTGHIVSYFSVH